MHGVLVWYRSEEVFRDAIRALMEQTVQPDTLTVVDNRGGRGSVVAMVASECGLTTTFLDAGDNLGPAGGWAVGVEAVLASSASDDDWVLLLDDDDIASRSVDRLADTLAFGDASAGRDGRVACVGWRGVRLSRRLGVFVPIPDADFAQAEVEVDLIPSNHFPLYRVGALREVGTLCRELFFSHEELEIGLRLKRHGYRVVASQRGFNRKFRTLSGRLRSRTSAESSDDVFWRRYYSRRNLLLILKDNRLWSAVVFQSLIVPAVTLMKLARWNPRRIPRECRVILRASLDALTGKVGRTVDPPRRNYSD